MDGINRDLFPILENKKYFNTCSIGALAKPVSESILKFHDQWNDLGGLAWGMEDGWMENVEKARNQFASIIRAKPNNIAFSFGNSVATTTISSAFNFTKKNEVVFNELDFPSSPAHLMALKDHGVNYKVANSDDGITINADNYKKVISDKTQLISACEVISNTGFRINPDELIEIAHENDIPVFLDTYQSTGYIPHDVTKSDIDFLASGCLKWLLGGFGISFIYIRDDWIDKLLPANIGWMGVENPFEDLYDKLRVNLHRPKDATKFQLGTPYPIGAITANEGMKIIKDIGLNRIFDYDMKITQEILEQASNLNLETITPLEKENRGSIVNIQINHANEIVQKLQEQGFVVDMRANGIRIAPHFYNNSKEVCDLFEFISTINKDM